MGWLNSKVNVLTITSVTQSALCNISASINTQGKYAGLQVWDSTNLMPVWASDSTAGAVWVGGTGNTVHTPV